MKNILTTCGRTAALAITLAALTACGKSAQEQVAQQQLDAQAAAKKEFSKPNPFLNHTSPPPPVGLAPATTVAH